ncbi:MAG: hydroxyisourate hydrolase [Deltaproteobacteria bacterium]|nr:hydroxyisourate hydrolase [Deltaproteobacteria bacterium]
MGISTHILDVTRGKPAASVIVLLERYGADGSYWRVGSGETDTDGRCKTLYPDALPMLPGVYRLSFAVAPYLSAAHGGGFYPEVNIVFEVADAAQHYHVPLLLSPFGYSTYRGS